MMLDSPLPMFVAWGPELRLLYNDRYATILGQRHPAGLGAPAKQVWAARWLDLAPLIARVLADEAVLHERVKIPVETLEGPDLRWFTFSLSPLRDGDSGVEGIMGMGVDTTTAVLSEDRLLYERNRIRDLFQQAPGFMALTAGPNHVIDSANDAYFSLVGDRELIGRRLRDALPELKGQGVHELLERTYASATPSALREAPIMLARHGADALERRFIDITYQPIKQGDRVVGILAEGYDVTDHKKAKEELMLLQSELIHASRLGAMSAMAATLAHELNQPLTVVNAYVVGARRMLDKLATPAADEIKLALAEARDATLRAGEIIRRLRAMVRRGEAEVEPADLGTVVREALSLSALGLAEEGVSLGEDISDDVPVSIDKIQIQQVVVNLFRNATEATLKSDRRQIEVSVRRARGSALLQIDDSGSGIDPADAQNIFSPMFTTKAAGLGVGLAISRTIVEAHRGTMWASESPLGGARLSVKLPLAAAPSRKGR